MASPEHIAAKATRRRRTDPNQDAATVRAVELVESRIARRFTRAVRPGRPETPRTRARKVVARHLGITINAVIKAETRHRKRNAPPLHCLGHEPDGQWLTAVAAAGGIVQRALTAAKTALYQLRKLDEYPRFGRVEAAQQAQRGVVLSLEGLMPEMVCPDCKGEGCAGCEEYGFLTKLDVRNRHANTD